MTRDDVTRLARREAGYLREDVADAVARARGLGAHATPARRMATALTISTATIIYGFAQWWTPAAWVVAGLLAFGYGAFLVDLDPATTRGRRSTKAVPRKKRSQ